MTLQEIRLDPCRVCKEPHAYHVNPVEKVGRTTCERDLELGRSPPTERDWIEIHIQAAIELADGIAITEAQYSLGS